MARIGIWIASEDSENLESEDFYFWLRDLIYEKNKISDEVFIFGLANRNDNFKSYLDDLNENISGINFCTVPDNSKFELEVKKLHWRIFRVFEIVRDAHRFLFLIKWALERLISFFDTLSLRSWPRRLVSSVNRSKLDYLIVPDVFLTEWVGTKCPVKLWDRRSAISASAWNDAKLRGSLNMYSAILVGSHQMAESLKQISKRPNLVKYAPPSKSSKTKAKLESAHAVIQRALAKEYNRNGNFYYPDLDLINIPYLVCTIRDRGQDNVKNLIRAYEDLIRNKRINCKLIFTAELDVSSRNLVADLGLLFDVLWIKEMHPLAVEMCIQFSKCLVIPSRSFEDGLASWFKASYYGVPACVADSKSLQQKNGAESIRNIVFNAESVQSISNSLKYAILNREQACLGQGQFINANYDENWESYRLQIIGS